ncbi:hypothetical protein [Rossellomorea marisflavi]|uniref:hypothetical protein n=1 Tax=Rossellomorea marisflavi TaxID=189381 RepID=UPI003FA0FE46
MASIIYCSITGIIVPLILWVTIRINFSKLKARVEKEINQSIPVMWKRYSKSTWTRWDLFIPLLTTGLLLLDFHFDDGISKAGALVISTISLLMFIPLGILCLFEGFSVGDFMAKSDIQLWGTVVNEYMDILMTETIEENSYIPMIISTTPLLHEFKEKEALVKTAKKGFPTEEENEKIKEFEESLLLLKADIHHRYKELRIAVGIDTSEEALRKQKELALKKMFAQSTNTKH